MTDRAEIERLLNQTGRTLEGLPTEDQMFNDPKYPEKIDEYFKARNATLYDWPHTFGLHQSDVIELLVGALRDALDKQPKRRSVKFVPCVCGHNTHSEWYNCENYVWSYECNKCGLKSDKYAAKTKTGAKIGWNRMIEELKAGELHD